MREFAKLSHSIETAVTLHKITNICTTMKVFFSLLATVVISSPVVATTTFVAKNLSCDSPVQVDTFDVNCDDDACTYGNAIYATGSGGYFAMNL